MSVLKHCSISKIKDLQRDSILTTVNYFTTSLGCMIKCEEQQYIINTKEQKYFLFQFFFITLKTSGRHEMTITQLVIRILLCVKSFDSSSQRSQVMKAV